jgi:UDP-N-acetylglucosamine 2-epimerase (non-hydrolysing)
MAARLGVAGAPFAVATLHRAGNVDSRKVLAELAGALADLAETMPVLFPIHPRTRQRIVEFGLEGDLGSVRVIDPLGYLETVGLVADSSLVVTDSGGLQAETTVLGVPCLTARDSTEWVETLTQGTNHLVPPTRTAIAAAVRDWRLRDSRPGSALRPDGWDGNAGRRALQAIRA